MQNSITAPSFLTTLVEKLRLRLDKPKFYELGLESRVRGQVTIVTELINDALTICRATHTDLLAPDVSGQIGYAGLRFEIVDMPVDGVVDVAYTGPQARMYYDVLTKGLGRGFKRSYRLPVARVKSIRFTRRTHSTEPSVTARLYLPIKVIG